MKREPSILAHSLRAVVLVITLVSLVTFSTVGYTAYADVSDVLLQEQPGAVSLFSFYEEQILRCGIGVRGQVGTTPNPPAPLWNL